MPVGHMGLPTPSHLSCEVDNIITLASACGRGGQQADRCRMPMTSTVVQLPEDRLTVRQVPLTATLAPTWMPCSLLSGNWRQTLDDSPLCCTSLTWAWPCTIPAQPGIFCQSTGFRQPCEDLSHSMIFTVNAEVELTCDATEHPSECLLTLPYALLQQQMVQVATGHSCPL